MHIPLITLSILFQVVEAFCINEDNYDGIAVAVAKRVAAENCITAFAEVTADHINEDTEEHTSDNLNDMRNHDEMAVNSQVAKEGKIYI